MRNPHHHWRKNLLVDSRLGSYNIQLTRKWARKIGDAAAPSPKLSDIVYDFGLSMRSVGITASLPHTVVAQFDTFVTSYTAGLGSPPVQKLAVFMAERLARTSALAAALRSDIRIECLRIAAQSDAIKPGAPFSIDDVWKDYLEHPGYKIALWDSQRMGIVNAYNCYENLLTRCMAVAVKQRVFHIKRKFPGDFAREFGQSTCDDCWTNPEVQTLRLVRNCIVHEGGRETGALKLRGHRFRVKDDVLHPWPENLNEALRLIEQCANRLVAAAVKHPNFLQTQKRKAKH